MSEFEKLKKLVDELQEDADKFYMNGTKAAGTRLRKGMMGVKDYANIVRKEVQDKKKGVGFAEY